MFRSIFCLLTVAGLLALANPARADHGCCNGAAGCGCHVQCPQCHHYCKLSVDKEKVENYCWEVECKPVCVPRVHFPWECGCPPKCARVIHVNVLKKHTYECEKCAYSWSPEPAECCGNGCGAGGCCDGACNGGCAGGSDVGCATAPAETAAPVEAQPEPAGSARSAPEPAPPLTGQRPTWFDSAKVKAVQTTTALPVRFIRAAKGMTTK
jgi:hypothetical protein